MRKLLIVIFMLSLSQLSQAKICRFLSESEIKKINRNACETFGRIYKANLNVDQKKCQSESKFMICEDSVHGQSLLGTLVVDKNMTLNECVMYTKNKKVTHVDCIKY